MKRIVLLLLVAFAFPAAAAAAPAPVTWCGNDEVAADRVPDLDQASADQVRFVYVIPSDGVDRFAAVASGIATDAAWIDGWWRTQDPARTPRFDRYGFPGCATTFGALDIGFVRLPNPASTYVVPNGTALRLDTDLVGRFPSGQKTIVYYDGRTFDSDVCGETDYLSDDFGGDFGIAYVYLDSGCDVGSPGSGATAEVAAHELVHNLGAVPEGAPNECDTSASHACDSTTDLMYPFITPGTTLDSVLLDVGHDDYYAHTGTWWDVRNSDWLTRLPQQPFSLALAGEGTVSVIAGSTELPCESGCDTLQLDDGESLSVTAIPALGWKFAAWSGGCSGAAPDCTVSVGGPTSIRATFVRSPLRLTVAVRGRGRVRSTPAALDCSRTCKATFTAHAVRLAAVPTRGWRFTGWGGACMGKGRCTVTATATVRARFQRRQ